MLITFLLFDLFLIISTNSNTWHSDHLRDMNKELYVWCNLYHISTWQCETHRNLQKNLHFNKYFPKNTDLPQFEIRVGNFAKEVHLWFFQFLRITRGSPQDSFQSRNLMSLHYFMVESEEKTETAKPRWLTPSQRERERKNLASSDIRHSNEHSGNNLRVFYVKYDIFSL